MRIAYFPGCSLTGSAREFDESLRAVARRIGLNLVEVPDWNCCGASSAHALDHVLSAALPARILALTERTGVGDLLVPCSACYNRLISTVHELKENPTLRAEVRRLLGMELHLTVRVRNVLEVLKEALEESNSTKIVAPFSHKVACYYGCLLVRPHKVVGFDRPENPQSMDELMRTVGAEPIHWAFKVECCGAGMTLARTELVARLCSRILDDAQARGADVVITACPMCHANLDMRRSDIEAVAGRRFSIPVMYVTQAVGLALGATARELGLDRHMVDCQLLTAGASKASTAISQP
ncbi:MAG TPA: CoB--CoM heterodisulfide reductase iron-sulfur subunit B family protein [Acidobacteriota bacterium]|nr:CoB--CoM heterodisulfide reductase iron-sulfur subunit B family protein [Acidobacteriota bacterium]